MWQVWRPDLVLVLEQGRQLPDDLGGRVLRQPGGEFRAARAPVQALDLIGEDDALNGEVGRKRDLERISLGSTRDRAEQPEPDLPVVGPGRDDDGGPTTGLLVARLRVQSDPDDVTAVRNVGASQLPDFPARSRAHLHLGMTIPLRNFLQQLA